MATKHPRPPLEHFAEFLRYEPETGHFYWIKNPKCWTVKVGDRAGGQNKKGYWRFCFKGKTYETHRLAYLFMTGHWPAQEIDHINCDTIDNRWSNLRLAGREKNAQNQRGAQRGNRSGLLGVSTRSNSKRFIAQISFNGKSKYIGTFDTAEEAHAAYLEAKRMYHEGCTL